MAKKKAVKKKKFKQPKRIPVSIQDYMKVLIIASERAITPHGSRVDEFFQQQAERLKKELRELSSKK